MTHDFPQQLYPPDFCGRYTRHQLETGICFLTTAEGHFPEDIWPRIQNITSEEIQSLIRKQ